ncbi:TPA: primosomal protein DnaI [Streptococcus suis]|jgi:primosomal protein DnaI|uniref:primosomal protein DnaI n=1 Tax=Streptococcus TaxID=1301 RepID=UPI001551F526|nr:MULTISPECIES: primosomal protein DnaI [Streptococcus]MBV1943847.1 primosomal protein DnaI [Streptococcus parasuis]MCO8174632.1 primosomal protein DnaI [Streptococcus suis]MCO8209391.1 primosomal protein DnaI [Streptococcus suis]MDG3145595.1 primosomal protein DnaI [Streptococcus suis]MDG3181180.1 primosomal protein DnaI [Streptococcus suis]
MKSVQDKLSQATNPSPKSYQQLYQEIVSDTEVAAFIKKEGLTQKEITLSISKFLEYISQRDLFVKQDEAYIAKGYQPVLVMNEGYADVSYLETEELVEYRRLEAIKNRIQLINMPASLKNVTVADIDKNDENRVEVMLAITDFVKRFEEKPKGLYIYGNFGIGKSYLMAYLANLLSKTYLQSTTMLHYPTFVVDIKNAIKDGSVKERIDEIKLAQVLVLDDIGAEQHSPWVRDDVLQVILQYRMQENLPTFFTSNFSFDDLERHFASGKSGDETWQAKRVMERIRYLARDLHLKGNNRR